MLVPAASTLVIGAPGGADDVEADGDGLGVGDGDGDGDGESDGDGEIVGDADAVGDLAGDDLAGDGAAAVRVDVPREVRVSIAGKMSAGTGPGKTLGDEAGLPDDPGGDVAAGPDPGSAGEDSESFG